MKHQPLNHRTFVISMWRERGASPNQWRFVLIDPTSGQRLGFVSKKDVLHEIDRQFINLQNDQSNHQK